MLVWFCQVYYFILYSKCLFHNCAQLLSIVSVFDIIAVFPSLFVFPSILRSFSRRDPMFYAFSVIRQIFSRFLPRCLSWWMPAPQVLCHGGVLVVACVWNNDVNIPRVFDQHSVILTFDGSVPFCWIGKIHIHTFDSAWVLFSAILHMV